MIPGDINKDGRLDLSDAARTLGFLFGQFEAPCASEAGNERLLDTNGDMNLDLADAKHIDREMLGIEVGLQRIGDLRDVPEHERRFQRHRAEAVRGDAAGPFSPLAGDDGDATPGSSRDPSIA